MWTRLIGREAELAALLPVLGGAGLVTVSGEAGIGKSRLTANRLDAMGAHGFAAQARLESAELTHDHDALRRSIETFTRAGMAPWRERAHRLARWMSDQPRQGGRGVLDTAAVR